MSSLADFLGRDSDRLFAADQGNGFESYTLNAGAQFIFSPATVKGDTLDAVINGDHSYLVKSGLKSEDIYSWGAVNILGNSLTFQGKDAAGANAALRIDSIDAH